MVLLYKKYKKMKAKNIILGGLGLAIVGAGTYFYFKNKKKPSSKILNDTLSSISNSTTTSAQPLADTILATAPVINANAPLTNEQSAINNENLIKFNQAQSLANQISNLRLGIKTANFQFGGDMQTYTNNMTKNAEIQSQIQNIVEQMNTLGYKEVNGLAVKL